jgi:hypothetical protein
MKVHKRTVRRHKSLLIKEEGLFTLLPTATPSPPHRTPQKKTSNDVDTPTALTTTTTTTTTKPAPAATAVASAARKAKLKGKGRRAPARRSSSSTSVSASAGGGHVLGGADYVDIMMGSRRREREEAQKLPRDES